MPDDNGQEPPSASASSHIPETLRKYARWIPWTETVIRGKARKKPEGSTRLTKNRRSWVEVRGIIRSATGGVGFVLTGGIKREKDGATLLAFDIDGCRCPRSGVIEQWAVEHIKGFRKSYTEVTPSGSGLRQWVWVLNAPDKVPKINVTKPAPKGVTKNPEIQTFGCGAAAYVTVTGDKLEGTSAEPMTVEVLGVEVMLARWEVKAAHGDHVSGSRKKVTAAHAREMLVHVPNYDDRQVWLDVGMGLQDQFDELGFDLWEEWGKQSHKHDADDSERVWQSIGGRGITFDTVAMMARDNGYKAQWTDDTTAEDLIASAEIIEAATKKRKAKKRKTRRSRLYSPSKLRAKRGRTQYLVKGMMTHRGFGIVWGKPKCGKSTSMVDLILCIISGAAHWGGRSLPLGAGCVALISGEGTDGLLDRIIAGADARGISRSMVDERVMVTEVAGRMSDPEDVAAWIEDIGARVGEGDLPLRAIFLDTLARNFGDGDENSTQDAGRFLKGVEALDLALEAVVVAIHHCGLGDEHRFRGSSTFGGALDFDIKVTCSGDVVRLIVNRSKDFREGADVVGQLVDTPTDWGGSTPRFVPAADRVATILGAWSDEQLADNDAVEALDLVDPGLSLRKASTVLQWNDSGGKTRVDRARKRVAEVAETVSNQGRDSGTESNAPTVSRDDIETPRDTLDDMAES